MAASGLYIPTPSLLSFSLRYRRAVPKTMLDIAFVAAVLSLVVSVNGDLLTACKAMSFFLSE
jgi:hypothetical protein